MKRVNRSYKEEATTALFKCWESKTSRNIIMRWWNGQTDWTKLCELFFICVRLQKSLFAEPSALAIDLHLAGILC